MGEAGGAAEAAPANDEADATMYEVNSGAALEAAAMGDGGTTEATTIDNKFSKTVVVSHTWTIRRRTR